MPNTADVIRDRIESVCAKAPFTFTRAQTPFDFDKQPTGAIDGVFRITMRSGSVIGGFNFSEECTDLVEIWVARKQTADPKVAYRQLVTDARSIRAAVIRDGVQNGGDFTVPDSGTSYVINTDKGREFAVLRQTVPVNYDAVL